jgi:hypothetical protein
MNNILNSGAVIAVLTTVEGYSFRKSQRNEKEISKALITLQLKAASSFIKSRSQ